MEKFIISNRGLVQDEDRAEAELLDFLQEDRDDSLIADYLLAATTRHRRGERLDPC